MVRIIAAGALALVALGATTTPTFARTASHPGMVCAHFEKGSNGKRHCVAWKPRKHARGERRHCLHYNHVHRGEKRHCVEWS